MRSKYGSDAVCQPELDAWMEVVGETSKGHVYGLGYGTNAVKVSRKCKHIKSIGRWQLLSATYWRTGHKDCARHSERGETRDGNTWIKKDEIGKDVKIEMEKPLRLMLLLLEFVTLRDRIWWCLIFENYLTWFQHCWRYFICIKHQIVISMSYFKENGWSFCYKFYNLRQKNGCKSLAVRDKIFYSFWRKILLEMFATTSKLCH